MTITRRHATRVAMAAALVLGPLLASGCGDASDANAPTVAVVVTLWPLAQLVSLIGGPKVTVIDLATPGSDPRRIAVTPTARAELSQAALVVDVGGGYQPALESAIVSPTSAPTTTQASHPARVVSLYPALGGPTPAVWLNPQAMKKAIPLVTDALAQINPPAATSYHDGGRDFTATLSSLNIDYSTTFGNCSRKAFVTSDDDFASLAAAYSLVDRPVDASGTTSHSDPGSSGAPTAAELDAAVSTIRSTGTSPVFSEPLADNTLLDRAAAVAGVKVKSLDSLEGPPPGGWPSGATYFSLMEANLTTLSKALQCATFDGS